MATATATGTRFMAACDFPTTFAQSFVLAPTTTFAQLKAALATALNTAAGVDAAAAAAANAQDVKSKPGAKPIAPAGPIVAPASLAAYGLVIVKYRSVPIDIAGSKEDATIKDIGVSDGCTIVVTAPVAVLPKKVRAAHKLKKKEDEESGGAKEKKKKGDDRDADDYKGLKLTNAIEKWRAAEEGSKKKKLAFEYIEMFGTDILTKPGRSGWRDLTRKEVAAILASDSLNVEKEVQVLEAAIDWIKEAKDAKASNAAAAKEAEDKKLSDGDKLKAQLGELFTLIRFPSMEVTDIALNVAKYNLLNQEQTLALFTFLGQRAAAGKDSKSGSDSKKAYPPLTGALKDFNPKPRTGREVVGAFEFDDKKMGNQMILSNKNLTVTQNSGGSTYNTVATKRWLSKGVHTVHFKLDSDNGQHYIYIGLLTRQYNAFSDHNSGALGNDSYSAYGWSSMGGPQAGGIPARYGPPPYGGEQWGAPWQTGDTITMKVDMDAKSCSFALNGTDQGVCFHNLPAEVCPAISTYSNGDKISIVSKVDKTVARPPPVLCYNGCGTYRINGYCNNCGN